jgi:hypothetical protein
MSAVVLDDVLEFQEVISRLHHRVETVVDLALTGGSHLVVRTFNLEASVGELEADLIAQVGEFIDGTHREVAALVRRLVGEVSALFLTARVPGGLFRIDR